MLSEAVRGRPRPSLEVTRERNPRETGVVHSLGRGPRARLVSQLLPGPPRLRSVGCLPFQKVPSRPRDTHVDAQPECGDGGRLAQGEQEQEQGRRQLHQVEEVAVCEEVGRQRSGVLGVGEELVVILAFLKARVAVVRAPDRAKRGAWDAKAAGDVRWAGKGAGPWQVGGASGQRGWTLKDYLHSSAHPTGLTLAADGAPKTCFFPKLLGGIKG